MTQWRPGAEPQRYKPGDWIEIFDPELDRWVAAKVIYSVAGILKVVDDDGSTLTIYRGVRKRPLPNPPD